MNRRAAILALVALGAAPVAVLAQQERRVRRIGYFSASSPRANVTNLAAFRAGMTELGWVEGRDYMIDARYAHGVTQSYSGLAAELVASQPDLLLVNADEGLRLFAHRTKTIPIVFANSQDPLGDRVVVSLQRPGGNATGLSSLARDLGAKRLQLVREAFPNVAHVVVLSQAGSLTNLAQVKDIEDAAELLKIRITSIELRKASDIEPAFKRGAALGAHAYLVTSGPLLTTHRKSIADAHCAQVQLCSRSEFTERRINVVHPLLHRQFPRAAGYVDKIFKGAKPGELPSSSRPSSAVKPKKRSRQGHRRHHSAIGADAGGSGYSVGSANDAIGERCGAVLVGCSRRPDLPNR
jgi:putative ABC transport system substrate-binding protein